jgi:hypothetical protein
MERQQGVEMKLIHAKTKKTKAKRPPPTDLDELWRYRKEDSGSLLAKAQRCLTSRAATEPSDHAVLQCLTGMSNRLPEPIMSDLELRQKMAQLLVGAFLNKRHESANLDIALGTVLNASWDTSLESPEVDIYRVQAETRGALSSMFTNWLSVIELQTFANVHHETGGYLVSVHCHFIGYGIDARRKAETNWRGAARRFSSRLPGVEPLKIDWVGDTELDVARAVSYPWKPPLRSKTLYVSPDQARANLHESEANDRFVRYLRMIEILSMLRTDRIVYGANHGASIRGDALREARSWLKTGERDRQPPIHSNAIPHYWIDLWQRLGESRFKLPLIKYKKL